MAPSQPARTDFHLQDQQPNQHQPGPPCRAFRGQKAGRRHLAGSDGVPGPRGRAGNRVSDDARYRTRQGQGVACRSAEKRPGCAARHPGCFRAHVVDSLRGSVTYNYGTAASLRAFRDRCQAMPWHPASSILSSVRIFTRSPASWMPTSPPRALKSRRLCAGILGIRSARSTCLPTGQISCPKE